MNSNKQTANKFKHPMDNYDDHNGTLYSPSAPAYFNRISGSLKKHYGSFTGDSECELAGKKMHEDAVEVLKLVDKKKMPSKKFSGFHSDFYG